MKRRHLLTALAAGIAVVAVPAGAAAPLPQVHVYKSPTCGCCGAWVEHLEAAGFPVKVTEMDDPGVARRQQGLPDEFGSCHTALVAGYVVEGHVPASDIKKLLAMKPVALGLAVPGMPIGSPGMEMGSRKDPYQVMLVDKQGRGRVFSSHR